MRAVWLLSIGILGFLAYAIITPGSIQAVAWVAPKDIGFDAKYKPNTLLSTYESLSIGDQIGPEDIAIDKMGAIYTGSQSGWILRIDPTSKQIDKWVNTEGRPLGIEFDNKGNLWVADAFKGLLRISANGDVDTIVDSFQDSPLRYVDDLDIASNGDIYFSDASQRFGAESFGDPLDASLYDIMEHSCTGRVLKYSSYSKETSLMMGNLCFANGVRLGHGDDFILVNETGEYRVWKHWLKGDKKGQSEVLIENLPGFPDNVSRSQDGHYWLGLVAPRNRLLDQLSEYPFVRNLVQRLPAFMRPEAEHYGHVVKFDGLGRVLKSMQDPSGRYPKITGVTETKEFIYLTSLGAKEIGRIRK